MSQPQSLVLSEDFLYKGELISALKNSEPCRRLDEGRWLAGELAGTYQIRARMAKDPVIQGVNVPGNDLAVRDLATIASGLSRAAPEAVIAVYSIGPTKDGFKYDLFELECDGQFVGCLRGPCPYEG